MLSLINVVENHFLDEAQPVMVCESKFNELFHFLYPRFNPSVLCVPSPTKEEEDREMERERELSFFFHLYICALHTLFGPLDLIDQSSELG